MNKITIVLSVLASIFLTSYSETSTTWKESPSLLIPEVSYPPDCCNAGNYTIHLMPPKWDENGDIINLACYLSYLAKFDQVKLDFLNNVHSNCPKCPTDPTKHECSCVDWYYHLATLDNGYYYQLHYLSCIAPSIID